MNSFMKFIYNLQQSEFGSAVSSMFTLPTVGLPTELTKVSPEFATVFKKVEKVLSSLGLLRGIPIYASSQKEIGENNIGQQVLIRANELGTQVITDNIAPLPRVWDITGYVGRKKYFQQLQIPTKDTEDNNLKNFVEGINYTVNGVDNLNTAIYLNAIKDYFRYLRILRAPFNFITREGTTISVLMQNYTFEDEPISEFATKVTMRVMEYVALSIDGLSYNILNTPGLGSIYGVSAKYSTSASKVLGSSLKMLLGK